MAKFLPGHLVDSLLMEVHGWHRRGPTLEKIYPTTGHAEALAFVSRVADAMARAAHEPALDARASGRTVYLTIHSPAAGGITDRHRPGQGAGPARPSSARPGRPMGDPASEASDVIGPARPR